MKEEVDDRRKVATEATLKEEAMIDGVQRMKRTAQEIMGKKSSRVTHALGNKSSLYFWSIVSTGSCNGNV